MKVVHWLRTWIWCLTMWLSDEVLDSGEPWISTVAGCRILLKTLVSVTRAL